jgi:hypothetical protein
MYQCRLAYELMNALDSDAAELELTSDLANTVEALAAEIDSAAAWDALQARESTVTQVMEKILQFRPPSHWGINE